MRITEIQKSQSWVWVGLLTLYGDTVLKVRSTETGESPLLPTCKSIVGEVC